MLKDRNVFEELRVNATRIHFEAFQSKTLFLLQKLLLQVWVVLNQKLTSLLLLIKIIWMVGILYYLLGLFVERQVAASQRRILRLIAFHL